MHVFSLDKMSPVARTLEASARVLLNGDGDEMAAAAI
jgi:hypothetical protein